MIAESYRITCLFFLKKKKKSRKKKKSMEPHVRTKGKLKFIKLALSETLVTDSRL